MKKRKFSPSELRLMALLPDNGDTITTSELNKLFYGSAPPKMARQAITFFMRSLADKAEYNREKFVVCRTERKGQHAGPHESAWWIKRS
jgi:hypothetical protein